MTAAKQTEEKICGGKDVLPFLAEIYQQLYLKPGPEGEEAYPLIVRMGQDVPEKDLGHFHGDERDSLVSIETPAGQVRAVTLHDRRDFEQSLQIMAYRGREEVIPPTQGSALLDGIISWTRIREHKKTWMREQLAEGNLPDWNSEFRRFTEIKSNYTDALIVLSEGPYSGVSGEGFGIPADEWLSVSHTIRKYHECTHFLCRRLYPEQVDAVWDEIAADAVGIAAALGRFDPEMEARFLGIGTGGYTGGRLENYTDGEEDLDAAAVKIHEVLLAADRLYSAEKPAHPFDFAVMLEEKQGEWW